MSNTSLLALDDSIRIPAELLLAHLKELKLTPTQCRVSPEGSLMFLFETEKSNGVVLTADIEIEEGSVASASIIPYKRSEDGLEYLPDEAEPLDLWEIEEEPPYLETVQRIVDRFTTI